jgi:cytochrome b involved in lipid metabolism
MSKDKIITLDELKAHGKEAETQWICINGIVADITNYKTKHPGKYIFKIFKGGIEIIIDSAGKDASKEFQDAFHSDDAFKIVQENAIGKLENISKNETEKKEEKTEEMEEVLEIHSSFPKKSKIFIFAIIPLVLTIFTVIILKYKKKF